MNYTNEYSRNHFRGLCTARTLLQTQESLPFSQQGKPVTGFIRRFTNLSEANAFMQGMRSAPDGKNFIYRLRARGPRQTPEVIDHFLRLDYTHYVTRGCDFHSFEDFKIYMARYGCKYAKARANNWLPTKFGTSWCLYRNLRY